MIALVEMILPYLQKKKKKDSYKQFRTKQLHILVP